MYDLFQDLYQNGKYNYKTNKLTLDMAKTPHIKDFTKCHHPKNVYNFDLGASESLDIEEIVDNKKDKILMIKILPAFLKKNYINLKVDLIELKTAFSEFRQNMEGRVEKTISLEIKGLSIKLEKLDKEDDFKRFRVVDDLSNHTFKILE